MPLSYLLVVAIVLGILWPVDTSLLLSSCVPASSRGLLQKAAAIGLKAQSKPLSLHLNLITSLQSLFPNQVTFSATRC